jgi:plasmid stabilization system protein ParE
MSHIMARAEALPDIDVLRVSHGAMDIPEWLGS